jgi:hypothetical protein
MSIVAFEKKDNTTFFERRDIAVDTLLETVAIVEVQIVVINFD